MQKTAKESGDYQPSKSNHSGIPLQIMKASEAAREVSKNMHPISKIGDADDILPVIKWLLSPDAKWVTGQTIHVDGGLSTVKPR